MIVDWVWGVSMVRIWDYRLECGIMCGLELTGFIACPVL